MSSKGMNEVELEAPMEIQSGEIYVDEEGEWYYRGNRIIRDDIVALFLENLRIAPDGGFLIEWRNNRCAIQAADTPFVVSRVDRGRPGPSGEEGILLSLRHLAGVEPLDATSLRVGKGNVLYCRIRGGRFTARFSRPAYYQLAEWIEEDTASGGFYLELNGTRYPIG